MKYDNYYQKAYDFYQSDDLMIKAGWLDEDREVEFNPTLLTTPFNKLNIKEGVENKILLTTGSFGPVHQGHIAMMDKAKATLESKGYHVAGGYMSASHDNYVSTKRGMDMDVFDRVRVLDETLASNDWLMVDKWEALYSKTNINFTTVIDRLTQYLEHWLEEDIEIVYVFGSDNISFSYAFHGMGEFVCVNRDDSLLIPEDLIADNGRMHFVDMPAHSMSSTKIREARAKHKTERVGQKKAIGDNEGYLYYIRDDHKFLGMDLQKSEINGIVDIIESFSGKDAHVVDVQAQLKKVKKRLEGKKTISLDRYFDGDINANTCRLFHISEAQIAPSRLIGRNGEEDNRVVEEKGERYTFVDDDIATGRTLQLFKKDNPDIEINDYFFMNRLSIDQSKVFDIVDMRDFIVGAPFGGLCVKMPDGSITRVPYMAPYVDLSSRASIAPNKVFAMSMALWKANKAMYERTGCRVRDVHELAQVWMKGIGFKEDDRVADICQWHIEKMEDDNGL